MTPETVALACSSGGRGGSGYTASSLPPSLSHAHSHSRTHTCTHILPPHPSSQVPNVPPAKPKARAAQPTCQLSSHPPRADPMGGSRCFLSTAKKKIPPSPLWAARWAPPPQGDRGRAGRVGSVGLGAAVGREHLSHMPPGVRGWGAPCLEAGLREVLAHTHKPRPSLGVTPKTPERRPRHAWGERGPSAQLLSAAEQCLQGRVVTLG